MFAALCIFNALCAGLLIAAGGCLWAYWRAF